ncbi:ABC transporter permease [Kribbella solani]|uniref:ABC-2 type transport system permease protein n=1 Tax=Kribbella solani TaxID=236067 RepID=A0A841DTA4_9ACTN|nr:ABC-2 family transporter protein [Kribbella solani]MBB5981812.1 ABC-2 type transport system permease protein [Kribbella solani]
MSTVRAFRGMTRAGTRSVLIYRGDLVTGAITLVIQVVLAIAVWRTVYSGRAPVNGVDGQTAVSYAAIAACLQAVLLPWQFSSLPERIRNGQIATDLTRPLGLMWQVLGQNLGVLFGRLPLGVVGLVAAGLLGALTGPPGLGAALLTAVATVGGVAVAMLCNLIVSMVTFWTFEVSGPLIVYRFGSAFLSGSLIPLWFMPGWLRSSVEWLPFQAQVYTPVSIYLGQTRGGEALALVCVQLAWVVVLTLLLELIWRRARHKVVVQGG